MGACTAARDVTCAVLRAAVRVVCVSDRKCSFVFWPALVWLRVMRARKPTCCVQSRVAEGRETNGCAAAGWKERGWPRVRGRASCVLVGSGCLCVCAESPLCCPDAFECAAACRVVRLG